MKLAVSFLLIPMVLAGCSDGMHSAKSGDFAGKTYASDGERIYFTGQSESGSSITSIGGHHHMRMHGGSCVTCHGVNREGGARMIPWFWVTAPPLTASALTGDHEDQGHAHKTYDVNALKKAITEGINPAGEQLDDLMPRWEMQEKDLDSLVSYLLLDDEKPH
jgi:mono/diheme cytochrome c family protein